APDWACSKTLRASPGAMSYRNGGLANASATCCAAGSRTMGLAAGITVILTRRLGLTGGMAVRRTADIARRARPRPLSPGRHGQRSIALVPSVLTIFKV